MSGEQRLTTSGRRVTGLSARCLRALAVALCLSFLLSGCAGSPVAERREVVPAPAAAANTATPAPPPPTATAVPQATKTVPLGGGLAPVEATPAAPALSSPTTVAEAAPPPPAPPPAERDPSPTPVAEPAARTVLPPPPAAPPPPAPAPAAAFPDEVSVPGVVGSAFAVVDDETGAVLVSRHANERLPMASLTKVMTAILTLERANLDDIVEVGEEVSQLSRFSSVMGVTPGERLSVRDLLYGLMLPSGNDAAVVLAQHVSGDQAAFVQLMNRKAVELGLRNTHFANPHGLDSRLGDHYSSAYDLTLLARVAVRIPMFRTLMSARSWTAKGEQRTYQMTNGNLLLGAYPGAEGVKIGYTRAAGQTIVGAAVHDGRRLFVAVLGGSTQRVTDAVLLLDRGFAVAP